MKSRGTCGFSLVEVVLAIGIFSFAMVAILGLFGTSIGGVKKLTDRDVLVAAGNSIGWKLSELTRAELAAVSPGTSLAGRPVFYVYAPEELLASESSVDKTFFRWTNSLPSASDVRGSRVFRAAVYRANQSAGTEFPFDATNLSFPVRVTVDVLAPGQTSGEPLMSWSFHRTLVPTR